MSATTLQPRQPKGVPTGGEFATAGRPEADVDLLAAPGPSGEEEARERSFAETQPEAFTVRYDSVDDKMTAIKGELDQAVADLAEDDNWLRYLSTMSQFHRYSFSNQMLIAIQTQGKATKVAGFRAWEEKFNRHVIKGEKGLSILAPKTVTVTERDANGKPVKGPDGKAKKSRRMVGFTTATVFDVSQTEGEELPELERDLSVEPPEGFVEDMLTAAEKAGYTVEFREMDSHNQGTAQGWTDPRNKAIVIDSTQTPGSQADTLAHELGHVYAGHCDDEAMGDYHTGVGGCRGRMEVEAQSISYALTRLNGMQGNSAKLSAQYVAGWSRHDAAALRESGETVAKATKKILETVPFRNVEQA